MYPYGLILNLNPQCLIGCNTNIWFILLTLNTEFAKQNFLIGSSISKVTPFLFFAGNKYHF